MFLAHCRRFSTSIGIVDELARKIGQQADKTALSRAITLVESTRLEHRKQAQTLLERLGAADSRTSLRIGITGAPGVGKSTFINELGMHIIESTSHRLACLAIDPTSERTGGSILGDKTRMQKLSSDDRVYIRPSPASGTLGGVARSTHDTVQLCESAGYDVIIVESVGVGQSEHVLAEVTDMMVLIVAPGAGDELQNIKRGVTEMADLVLVNKAEDPMSEAARRTVAELKSVAGFATSLARHEQTLIAVSAHTGKGISETWKAILSIHDRLCSTGELMGLRAQQRKKQIWSEAKAMLIDRFEEGREASEGIFASSSGQPVTKVADVLVDRFLANQFGVMTLKKNVAKVPQKGPARNYISRSQALKKLQISLADFRRLCILKGIYPRDPKNKKKLSASGNTNVTYYWVKDVQFLLHEPLLGKLRETKAFAKKISKYIGRRDMAKVESLRENLQPTYSLDHLIKERYPTFADALRDLDDALSMLYLFASLPNTNSMVKDKLSSLVGREQANFAQTSAVLLREFEAYLVAEGCIKRSFVSIKGIYYQAEISGQTITWIVPHERTCPVPSDVDFRVMHTFLEFYHTLLGFVNFKLFSRLGWSYPLAPSRLRRSEREDESERYRPVLLAEDLPAFESAAGNGLFANFSVFLSREVPRHSLALLVQVCGGRVGWEDMGEEGTSPFAADSPRITHQIVDRPVLAQMYADRVYIQPQWIYDCINAKKLLDPLLYRIGAVLPPHLSPFVETAESDEDSETEMETKEGETMSAEQKKLAVSMLSKKRKKLYESLQRGIDAKSAEKTRLAQRRAELEASTAAAGHTEA